MLRFVGSIHETDGGIGDECPAVCHDDRVEVEVVDVVLVGTQLGSEHDDVDQR